MPITISIVEDNDKLRGTLAKVIGRAEGFQFVSDYASAEDALADLPKMKPEVVLMDINLPGMNGVECVRKLKALLPQTQVMMLTVYEDTENIFNALAAGANGYMLKRTPTKELIEAIREVHRGGSPMTTHIARLVVQSFQKPVASAQPARRRSGRIVRTRTAGARSAGAGFDLQGNRRQAEHRLRNRPHLHPPDLRKAPGAHADGGGGEIPPTVGW